MFSLHHCAAHSSKGNRANRVFSLAINIHHWPCLGIDWCVAFCTEKKKKKDVFSICSIGGLVFYVCNTSQNAAGNGRPTGAWVTCILLIALAENEWNAQHSGSGGERILIPEERQDMRQRPVVYGRLAIVLIMPKNANFLSNSTTASH